MESWYQSIQTPIFVLQNQHITREMLMKCKAAGISTLQNFVERPVSVIANETGLSMGEKAYRRLPPCYFLTALELHQEKISNLKIPTCSKALDLLLGGEGIESGSVTEIIAYNGVGKSQLCMTLSVTCQLPTINAGEGPSCIYVDTGKNFSTQRIISIANRVGLDQQKVLSNITYLAVKTSNRLLDAFKMIVDELKTKTYCLIIIDSATELFRVEYVGANVVDRNTVMANILHPLQTLAMEHRIAVVVTNPAYVVFEKWDVANRGPLLQPYGGHVMSSLSKTRIHGRTLQLGSQERKIELIASNQMPNGFVKCQISEGGLEDVKD